MFERSNRVLIIFLMYVAGCACDDDNNQQEVLKPLRIPKLIGHVYDQSSIEQLFEVLGINFFSVLPQLRFTGASQLWNELPSVTAYFTYSYWSGTNPYANICASNWSDGAYRVTEEGAVVCHQKCVEENQTNATKINRYFQIALKHAPEKGIKAEIVPLNVNVAECVPRILFYGLHCSCKSNYQLLVNEKLQNKLDEALSKKNFDKVIEAKSDTKNNEEGIPV